MRLSAIKLKIYFPFVPAKHIRPERLVKTLLLYFLFILLPHSLCKLLHLGKRGFQPVWVFIEQVLQHGEASLLHHQMAIFLWGDACQVGQGPYGPQLAFWCVAYARQADDGGEGAVVDVPPRPQVPPINGSSHAEENMIPFENSILKNKWKDKYNLSGCVMVHAPGPSLVMWASTPAAL